MITKIRHPKLNMDRTFRYSESTTNKECVLQKNEEKSETINKSANVNFTGGFFSPKKQDNVSFSKNPTPPKKGFWTRFGEKESVKKFFQNPKFHKFLEASNNLAVMESFFVLAISTTIKPISLLAVPGAKEEDKKYAATKAFLGGIVDFAIVTAFIKPITDRVQKFGEKVKKDPKILTDKVKYLQSEGKFKTFEKVMGYTPKLLLIPVRSALTIALIPPTLKYFFPEEGKKLKPKQENHSLKNLKTTFGETIEEGNKG